VINFSGLQGAQAEKNRLWQIYSEQGLKIQSILQGEEAGVYKLLQLLAANKLKVFASLSGLLVEYRIGDEHAPLLLACHALIHPACEPNRSRNRGCRRRPFIGWLADVRECAMPRWTIQHHWDIERGGRHRLCFSASKVAQLGWE
jgi:hypothetical protein